MRTVMVSLKVLSKKLKLTKRNWLIRQKRKVFDNNMWAIE